jgi:thiamine biosynthesis protein ThiS
MLEITYNGESRSIEHDSTIADLLTASGVNLQFCAVELNESVVPRALFSSQKLTSGDTIEVVTFVGGG